MHTKYFFSYLALGVLVVSGLPARQEEDSDTEESGFLNSLAVLPPQVPERSDLSTFPYESYHDIASSYGAPPPPQPSFGVSVNTQAILAPHVEIIRLLEGFLRLKGEVLSRFHALLNDNWDLIRAIINLVIGKIQNIHVYTLKGISVIRQVIEFALNLFSEWSVTLPSLTLGAAGTSYLHPHNTYGVPPTSAVSNFLSGFHLR